jgi:hypothetical protein
MPENGGRYHVGTKTGGLRATFRCNGIAEYHDKFTNKGRILLKMRQSVSIFS